MSLGTQTLTLNPIVAGLMRPAESDVENRPAADRRAQLLGVKQPLIDDPVQGCFARGNAALVIGDYESAIDYYTVVVNMYARHTVAYLRRGLAFIQLGQNEKARRDFERVLANESSPALQARAELAIRHLAGML